LAQQLRGRVAIIEGHTVPAELHRRVSGVTDGRLSGLDALSGALLQTTRTTGRGQFSFDQVRPGLYFIQMKSSGTQAPSGAIVVEVNPNAPVDRLLSLGMTSCGLTYSDPRMCPRVELHLSRLHGSVSDIPGAVDTKSRYALLDLMEQPIERTRSNDAGAFDLHHSAPGDYYLVANQNGFAMLRTTVHLRSSRRSSAHDSIKIELDQAHSCSAAYATKGS
jgi:hypothetical protein